MNRFLMDGARIEQAEAVLHRPKVMVFSPDRLELVKGPPAGRRAHVDSFIAARWPARAGNRSTFGRILAQRNALISRIAAGQAEVLRVQHLLAQHQGIRRSVSNHGEVDRWIANTDDNHAVGSGASGIDALIAGTASVVRSRRIAAAVPRGASPGGAVVAGDRRAKDDRIIRLIVKIALFDVGHQEHPPGPPPRRRGPQMVSHHEAIERFKKDLRTPEEISLNEHELNVIEEVETDISEETEQEELQETERQERPAEASKKPARGANDTRKGKRKVKE